MNDWIEWKGGICPIDGNEFIQVQYRGGKKSDPACFADNFYWHHTGKDLDIIAYRITENTKPRNKYHRQIKGVSVDVYDVLKAWNVTNPALQHLIKKALQPGERGHKDLEQDLQDIIDSAIRAKELENL